MSKKKILIIIGSILGVILIALAIILPLTLDSGYRSIKCHSLEGEVLVKRDDKELKAYENMKLLNNDTIEVKKSSALIIMLDSDKFIKAFEDSEIQIITSEHDTSKFNLRLNRGSALVEIKNKLKDDTFVVESLNSSMAIRGSVGYAEAKRINDTAFVKYSLPEGNAIINTYYKKDSKSYIYSGPLLKDRSFSIEIKDKYLLSPSECNEIEDAYIKHDENTFKNLYPTLEEMINKSDLLKPKEDIINKDIIKNIYDGLNEFKNTSNSLTTINASFMVLNTNIKDQISYDSNEPFKALIKANIPDGYILDCWYLNDERLSDVEDEITLDINGNALVRASIIKIDLETKFSATIKGGFINGDQTSVYLPLGSVLNISADNSLGYPILKVLVNGSLYDVKDSFEITLDKNLEIEFIYDLSYKLVKLTNSYIVGREGEDRCLIKENSEIILRSIDKRPVEKFIINGNDNLVENDFLKLKVSSDLEISAINIDCMEDETMISYEGFSVISPKELSKDGIIKRGSMVVLSLDLLDGYILDKYILNDEVYDSLKTTLTFTMDERVNIKAIFKENTKYNVSIKNGTIRSGDLKDQTNVTLYKDSEFVIDLNNPENLNCEGVLINDKPIYNLALPAVLKCSEDMDIDFILTKNDIRVIAYADSNLGGSVITNKGNTNPDIKDHIDATIKKGESMIITAKANPGYRFEGWFTRSYGSTNRSYIGNSESITLTPNSNISLYASFYKRSEAYVVIDESNKLEFNQNINSLTVGEAMDIDFNMLKLYMLDSENKKYVKVNEGEYYIECQYVPQDLLYEPDYLPEYISLNDISTNKPGNYLIEFLSKNSDNSSVNPFAVLALLIKEDVKVPSELLSLNLEGDDLIIKPSSLYLDPLALMNGGSNFNAISNSMNIAVIKDETQRQYIAINPLGYKNPILTANSDNTEYKFKGFSYNIAEGYKLYIMLDSMPKPIEYIPGSEIYLTSDKMLSLVIAPADIEFKEATPSIADQMRLIIAPIIFTKGDVISISLGENKYVNRKGEGDGLVKTMLLPTMVGNTPPVPNISENAIGCDINPISSFKTNEKYHDEFGRLNLRIKVDPKISNIRGLDGTLAAKNTDGSYSLNIHAKYKSYVEETQAADRYDYKISAGLLIYGIMLTIDGVDYTIYLNYYVMTPDVRQINYDELYNMNPSLAFDYKETNESLGYDKALYDYYFVEGGEGYNIESIVA